MLRLDLDADGTNEQNRTLGWARPSVFASRAQERLEDSWMRREQPAAPTSPPSRASPRHEVTDVGP
jgi:hypothetical protein